jgi:hypothetical protein
MDMLR